MNQNVFYCWQADRPAKTHRSFIEQALRSAIDRVNENSPATLLLDQATEDVRGLVNIPDHIREKLEKCSIFVVDLTIVASVEGSEKVQPNSNVLFEAGYVLAMMRRRKMEPAPVVAVMNTHYGEPQELPFDFGWRPVVRYRVSPEAPDETRRQARNKLARDLEGALRSIIEGGSLFAGLSTSALQVAKYFNETWDEGLAHSYYYMPEELQKKSGLDSQVIAEGARELLEKGFLEELEVLGASAGWPAKPTDRLFLVFDPYFQEWDPAEDARRILIDFGADEDNQIPAAEVQKRYGWPLRRIDVAMAKLIHDTLAENVERDSPYKYGRLLLTRRAGLFMAGRFDPDELQRRG